MAKVASAFAASGYTSCLFMAALGVPAMPEMIALNEVVCLWTTSWESTVSGLASGGVAHDRMRRPSFETPDS